MFSWSIRLSPPIDVDYQIVIFLLLRQNPLLKLGLIWDVFQKIMNLNFKSLGWYLLADTLVILFWKIWKPEWIEADRIIPFLVSSIVLWLFFERKKRWIIPLSRYFWIGVCLVIGFATEHMVDVPIAFSYLCAWYKSVRWQWKSFSLKLIVDVYIGDNDSTGEDTVVNILGNLNHWFLSA